MCVIKVVSDNMIEGGIFLLFVFKHEHPLLFTAFRILFLFQCFEINRSYDIWLTCPKKGVSKKKKKTQKTPLFKYSSALI